MIPEKFTFRLGSLAPPMSKRLKATGETPSQYVRRLIAEDLGLTAPAMDGHVRTLAKINKRRRKKKR